MSLLVLGISHRSAPLDLLDRLSLAAAQRADLVRDLPDAEGGAVREVLAISTCNRLELIADVEAFHSGLEQLGGAIAESGDLTLADLRDHLYVHYEDRAVAHVFAVAGGLDSLAVGETQILGQVRQALAEAQGAGTAGPALNALVQQALRVGKRVHAETGIDAVSRSLVTTGLDLAAEHLGDLAGTQALVVGAGALSGLVAAELRRRGAHIAVVNRTFARAERLAENHGGTAVTWDELADQIERADLVVSGTGATERVVTADVVRPRTRRLALLDLAMPRDVEPELAERPGVRVIALADLAAVLAPGSAEDPGPVGGHPAVQQAQDLVTGEVAEYLTRRSSDAATPVVVELRERANRAAARELERLWNRVPDLDDRARAEVERSVHRLVDKLLHTPTVRVRQLAGRRPTQEATPDYTHVLRELFDLDGGQIAGVSAPPVVPDVQALEAAPSTESHPTRSTRGGDGA